MDASTVNEFFTLVSAILVAESLMEVLKIVVKVLFRSRRPRDARGRFVRAAVRISRS